MNTRGQPVIRHFLSIWYYPVSSKIYSWLQWKICHAYLFFGGCLTSPSAPQNQHIPIRTHSLPAPKISFSASIYKVASIYVSFSVSIPFTEYREGLSSLTYNPSIFILYTYFPDPRVCFSMLASWIWLFLCQSYNIEMIAALQAEYVFILNLLLSNTSRETFQCVWFPSKPQLKLHNIYRLTREKGPSLQYWLLLWINKMFLQSVFFYIL